MEEQYMDVAANLLLDMRLKIEGAVDLYECDALPLRSEGRKKEMFASIAAFDAIGSALYDLREHIRNLQEAHMKEIVRLVWERYVQ